MRIGWPPGPNMYGTAIAGAMELVLSDQRLEHKVTRQ